MKWFWNFISDIYSELVVAGLSLPTPKLLFHQPNYKLKCCYQETILADRNFTETERYLITEARKDLEHFCNGMIALDIRFELDPEDKETIRDNCVLLRVEVTHPSIVESDAKLESITLGLCDYMRNKTRRLYLVPERLTNPITFRTTAIHELGHFIGLSHTEKPSIMHKHNNNNILYPTYIDAVELSKVWNCDIQDLRYFKLYKVS